MRFAELVEGVPGLKRNSGDAEVTSLVIDSRQARAGALFIAQRGSKEDGHQFVDSALTAGASAFVVSNSNRYDALVQNVVPVAEFDDTVDACWRLSNRFFGEPSKHLRVVGVTGTNGKTTTAWILTQMLNNVGSGAAYLGTLGARFGEEVIETSHTTSFPPETFALLRRAVDTGFDTVVMEVSSHALAQRRVDGVEFDVAVFTNLTQDHLDFHPSFEDYFAAKKRLFTELSTSKNAIGVVNVDDASGRRLFTQLPEKFGFGTAEDAELMLEFSQAGIDSLCLKFVWNGKDYEAIVPIGGRFNVENCLAAIGAFMSLGFSAQEAVDSLSTVKPAPGRFESVPTSSEYKVIVDYAHTPDALAKLLDSVRQVAKGRVITVFGCGGDRDRSKRPKMAAAVSANSDVVVVTSDNPRTEEPNAIIAEILTGLVNSNAIVEPDRRKAIHSAIAEARDSDVVVIAGKGHEDYQIIGTTKHHFDDREIAAEAVKEKAACV